MFSGVCLGGKLGPFSGISQNSTLEKRTIFKIQYEKNRFFTKINMRKIDSLQNSIWGKWVIIEIQYEKNRFFTKFNSIHVFWRVPHLPIFILEVKNAPCLFLEVKNKPFSFFRSEKKALSFFHHQQGEKAGFLPKIAKCYFKNMRLENSCTQKQQILRQNAILFLDGETFIIRSD